VEQHRLQGNFEGARRDLDEAIAIAEREDVMGRDQVNSYLEYTRLSLDMGETAKTRKSLETAKEIIARAGYHQWDEVVQELETQLRDEAKPGRTTRGP
jgi:hypothetical protein